jgi:probable rRNA maturation factor
MSEDRRAPEPEPSPSLPTIAVSNRQQLPVDPDELAEVARLTLSSEGHGEGELSLSFVTPHEMAELHERYLAEPGPTDVLAFPMGEDGLLGDVVICPAEAAKNNSDVRQELRLLVVHGVLHLLGYEHEEPGERELMWDRHERYAGERP